MTGESPAACHVCGAGEGLVLEPGFPPLMQITSDCRAWKRGGALGWCPRCGTVQKPATEAWRADADRIYGEYSIYHQGGGEEPSIFVGGFEQQVRRSEALFRAALGRYPAPRRGRLLDIGCGNGAVLRTLGRMLDGWTMTGADISDRYRATVESIPGVERLVVGPASQVAGVFDLVTMVHVLEHVAEPGDFLADGAARLAEDGLMLIQVPDSAANPFDLVVADHCSHFSAETLPPLVASAGLDVIASETGWMARQLVVLARRGTAPRPLAAPPSSRDTAAEAVSWLAAVRDHAAAEAARAPSLGVFGSANNAVWLSAELGDGVAFFVDEDPSRVGQDLLGRPIIAPEAVPAGSVVYVAMPPPWGADIARRLTGGAVGYILPPAMAGAAP